LLKRRATDKLTDKLSVTDKLMLWRSVSRIAAHHAASPRVAAAAFAAAASYSMCATPASSDALGPRSAGEAARDQLLRIPATDTGLRLVTYNVLSSHLCEPTYYVHSPPEDLKPETRLERVKSLLLDEMGRGSVVCLQEISTTWSGELTPFFEANGYTFVTGLYGNRFNGYMGVALAWPTYRFQSEAVDITRASDAKAWPKPASSPKTGIGAWWGKTKSYTGKVWRGVREAVRFGKPPRPPIEPWAESARRQNVLVSARLRDRATGRAFCVSTYHMPCLFGSDPKNQVMLIHSALVAQRAAAFADGLPFVLAGDFNIQPDSSPYEFLTSGTLPADHPHRPPPRAYDAWKPDLAAPLQSAYVVSSYEKEPDFTNFARTKGQAEPFVGTLDYIFLGNGAAPGAPGGWGVTQVKPLGDRKHVTVKSYPCADEPSDHVLVWAELELPAAEVPDAATESA